ncbi:MAG: hypothetical protein AB9856_01625 [Cellulosilyticaceae bacterium]
MNNKFMGINAKQIAVIVVICILICIGIFPSKPKVEEVATKRELTSKEIIDKQRLENERKLENMKNNCIPKIEFKEVEYKDNGDFLTFTGKMINQSGYDIKSCDVYIDLMDFHGDVVESDYNTVTDIRNNLEFSTSNGEWFSFVVKIEKVRNIEKYNVRYENVVFK